MGKHDSVRMSANYIDRLVSDKGCGNPPLCGNMTREEISVIRQQEALNAAEA